MLILIGIYGYNVHTFNPKSESCRFVGFIFLKDRQHRRRGGFAFALIVHKPKGVEYRAIYQMKGTIFLYALILYTKCSRVY